MTLLRRSFLVGLLTACFAMPASAADPPKKLLVVTVTKGFRHSSIPTAEKVLGELAERSKAFTVDYVRTDEDIAKKMTKQSLRQYDGFIFANTTGVLPLPDKDAFLAAVHGGKAFIGMHSASDTFHGKGMIDPYIDMCGGEFAGHGKQVPVDCLVMDPEHASTQHLEDPWHISQEEIYLLKNYDRKKVRDLLSLDRHPNKKEEEGHFPVSWCKTYGKGRVFYTSLGHREDIWDPHTPENYKRANAKAISEAYQEHILKGILWALGLAEGDATPLPASAYDR